MKSLLKKIVFFLCVFIALFLYVFAYWVYPDDRRVSEFDFPVKESESSWEFVGSVLKTQVSHSIDIQDDDYRELVERADKQVEAGLLLNSARFKSKYQIFAPLGTYPWRMEVMEALAIPDGKTLTVDVPENAEWLEFRVRNSGNAVITVSNREQREPIYTSSTVKVSIWPAPIQKLLKKYFFIGSYAELPRWKLHRMELGSTANHRVEFRCQTDAGVCIVSDPSFFKNQTSRKLNQTVLLIIDTLRADALSPEVMPRVSEFAKKAIVYQSALAPGNMTSPSTNGVLACKIPSDLGRVAFAYAVGAEHREQFYASGQKSFPTLLQQNGITTAMIGNISVVSEVFGVGVSHGFESQLLIEPESYETPLAVSEAILWLKENKHKDFLLYVHLNNPHAPYKPPFHFLRDQFRGLSDLANYTSVVKWLYRGEAAFSDHYVGRLFDYFSLANISPNVVFTSDHGDQHSLRKFSRNEIGKDFEGVYFDHGATLLNDEIAVPLVLKVEENSAKVSQNIVSSLWIGKTILSMHGVNQSDVDQCAGENLLNFIDPISDATDYPIIGSEGFQARAVVMNNRYKYIKTYEPTSKRIYNNERWSGVKTFFLKKEQLYDLSNDPQETKDLSLDRPELLAHLNKGFRNYFKINSKYELVLEAKGKSTFAIRPDIFFQPAGKDGPDSIYKGEFIDQLRIPFDYSREWKLPKVEINGIAIPIKATTLKIPFPEVATELHEEDWGWLRTTGVPSAFIARIVDEKRGDRKISLGNPAFERVLREWGYVNEN
jgi:arylsulfatase A-like enzyme